MHARSFAAAAGLLCAAMSAQATISVGSAAFTYSESFDTLTTSTATTAWANDATLAGWSLFNVTGAAITTYAADSGGSNTGTFRSYGSTGSGERALGAAGSGGSYFGSPASGAIAGWIAVAFSNDMATPITGFTLGFDGEQWRNGGNTSAQPMVLEYGFGSSFGSVTWTAPGGSFDWNSPVIGSTGGAVDGNAAGKVTGLGGTIATSWAPGDTLWIRWTERNDIGNDHGLAIDNLSFSVTAVPEPGTTALLLAGLAAVGFVARRRA
jgi:hypothetical protein